MQKQTTLISSIILIFFISSCQFFQNKEKEIEQKSETPIPEVVETTPENLVYGIIPADSFLVETFTIKSNDYLSSILTKRGVSYQTVDQISKNHSEVFNAKSIRAGNTYSLFFSKDTSKSLRYFVYEKSITDYVVISLGDSLSVHADTKPVTVLQKTVSGAVNSSLWNALADLKANPIMAVQLSDIYAWSIDFFGITKGDQFKIIYDETYVDSIPTGNTKIIAAEFSTLGSKYYAIPFNQDSILSFYDEQGMSLRKAFLKAPLKFSRISSKFTNNRFHPVLKISRPHHGVDYAAASGTPVHTIGDGTITKKGYEALGGGNYIKIKHNAVYETVYMHLKGFAKGIHVGQRVKQGELVGYVGMTGLATGPHLDFRVYKNGNPINPLSMEAPPVEPISNANKVAFGQARDQFIHQLDSIPFCSLEEMPSYVAKNQ